jgi:Sulfotransferase family
MDRVPVVFIVGTAYSGTTYLSLTLGSHSQMLAIGEVEPETLNTFWTNNQLCTCLFRARECHLWKRVMRSLSRVSERETFELSDPNNDLTSFLRTTHELFREIQRVSGKPILILSSKRVTEVREITTYPYIEPFVVHIIRDGRGVAYSHLKRGESFEAATAQWRDYNAYVASWLGAASSPRHMRIQYETFCSKPKEVVQRICEELSIEFEEAMMFPGRTTHHSIAGNTLRFGLAHDSGAMLDRTWASRLTSEQLATFHYLAGNVSQLWGYEQTEGLSSLSMAPMDTPSGECQRSRA